MTMTPQQASAMRQLVDHNCGACGREFRAIKKARYCSNACRQKAKYARKIGK